jgi:hypothetical protein
VKLLDDELTGSYSRLAGLLLNNASRVLVLAQSDELRMPQPICVSPLKEFNLSNRFWPQPNSFFHLFCV